MTLSCEGRMKLFLVHAYFLNFRNKVHGFKCNRAAFVEIKRQNLIHFIHFLEKFHAPEKPAHVKNICQVNEYLT